MAEKPSLLSRLRAMAAPRVVKEFGPKDQDAAAILTAQRNTAGQLVNARTAMSLSTVWACVRLIAESIAMLPLHLYDVSDDNPKVARRHPLNRLLSQAPNSKSTPMVFWESVVSAMLLQGNAYIQKKRDRQGKLVSLLFLAPHRLHVVRDMGGVRHFHYTFDDGVQREIPVREVWQLQGYTQDGRDGLSVIEYAAQILGSALAADQSAAKTFLNGMLQGVFYTINTFLQPGQRDEFKQSVRGTVERGEAPLLEGGVDVKSIGIKPQDAQLLQSRAFSVEEICRWFRVPPHMVGHNEKATGVASGLETQTLSFLTYTLQPWLERIQQGITLGLLEAGERERYEARFDTEALMQMDSTSLANYLGTMVQRGLMTANDARRKLRLPPYAHPNADKLIVQGAMITLDLLGTNYGSNNKKANDPANDLDGLAASLQDALKALQQGGTTN